MDIPKQLAFLSASLKEVEKISATRGIKDKIKLQGMFGRVENRLIRPRAYALKVFGVKM